MAEITTETTAIPADVKRPADRKVKSNKDGSRTVEVRGLSISVSGEVLDDFELLDDLDALDQGNGTRLPSVLRRLIGVENFKGAMEILRDPETGRVSVESGAEFVSEVLKAVAPNS